MTTPEIIGNEGMLIQGMFLEGRCPGCGVPTFSTPGRVGTLRCVDCGRAKHGASVPVRPKPGANNGYRLGQGGVGFSHVPRAPEERVALAVPPRQVIVPVVEVGPGFMGFRGRPPAGVTRRRYAAALIWVGEGSAENPRRGFDRWKLVESMVCDGPQVLACWTRSGRSGWKAGKQWSRTPNGWTWERERS
jgi:hypothetical protein